MTGEEGMLWFWVWLAQVFALAIGARLAEHSRSAMSVIGALIGIQVVTVVGLFGWVVCGWKGSVVALLALSAIAVIDFTIWLRKRGLTWFERS